MASTDVKVELVTEPPLPKGTAVDLAAILAKRRDRAVAEDAERAKTPPKPHDPNGVFGIERLTVEERLALLGISKDDLRSLLTDEGDANG